MFVFQGQTKCAETLHLLQESGRGMFESSLGNPYHFLGAASPKAVRKKVTESRDVFEDLEQGCKAAVSAASSRAIALILGSGEGLGCVGELLWLESPTCHCACTGNNITP